MVSDTYFYIRVCMCSKYYCTHFYL
uniref:Uncharacterized protein n=1 Tax=Anguilla anguilla TaxID=7936 RepID=A0A0E9VVV0_ANGAN